MKILLINETCGTGSHGRICVELARKMEKDGHVCKIAYGRSTVISEDSKELAIHIGNTFSVLSHVFLTRIFDLHGFGSYFVTRRFLNWVDQYDPDMIWLHNIHGYYIHLGLLFSWIKKHPKVSVKWTLHDCWSFTGHCSHYMAVGCSKWKTQCSHCVEKKQYPASLLIDNSYRNYKRKKELFTGIPDLTLITPSQWLADQVKESFLKEYPVSVVYNEIDHEIYKPISFQERSDEAISIYAKYRIPGKKQIVLGVASKWTKRKGLDDFIQLDQLLDHNKQVLVLVGLKKAQLEKMPSRMIGIERTENREELAGLYRAANVFVNLTYEENYPTVNLEAEACGTDVLTYDAGGCRETVHREGSKVFPVGDLNAILNELQNRLSYSE